MTATRFPRFSLQNARSCLLFVFLLNVFMPGRQTAHADLILSFTPESFGIKETSQPGAVEVQVAIERFRRGQLDDALESLEAGYNLNPELPPPPVMLARLLLAVPEPVAARQVLEKAAIDHPESASLYVAFANLALLESRLTDAQVHLDKASGNTVNAARRSKSVALEILRGYAFIAERRQNWKEAEKSLSKLVKLDPNDSNAKHRLGVAVFHLDDIATSELLLREAATADKALDPAPLTLAWLLHSRGDSVSAVHWMDTALDQAGEDSRVLRAASLLHYSIHDLESASIYVSKWLAAQSDSADAILLSATLARSLGKIDEAKERLESRLNEVPGDFAAAYQLIVLLADSLDAAERQRAVQRAELLRRQYPQSPLATTAFAWSIFKANSQLSLDQQSELVAMFEQAIGQGASDAEVIYQFARLLVATGADERSTALLEELLASNQPFPGRGEAVTDSTKASRTAPQSESNTPTVNDD